MRGSTSMRVVVDSRGPRGGQPANGGLGLLAVTAACGAAAAVCAASMSDVPSSQVGACLMTALLLALGVWVVMRGKTMPLSTGGTKLPSEHPYYQTIDQTTQRFRSQSAINLSEARRRARYRSHDPRRWRARMFGTLARGAEQDENEGEDDGEASPPPLAMDYPALFEWATAEKAMTALEDAHGITIQRPPLGYSNESARRLAQQAGCAWYFSIADFDEALLHGTIEIKHTDGEQSILLDLSSPSTPPALPAKPDLLKKGSPSDVMDCLGR